MNKMFDFTKGNIPLQMIRFSFSIFVMNLLQSLYKFIDSLWVGNLIGDNALSAISLASMIIFTMFSFIIGINSASLTIYSQLKGAQDNTGLKDSLNSFVVTLGLLSVLLGLMGIFSADWILAILQTPSEIYSLAKEYLRINFIGSIFFFGYNFLGTILSAMGDSRTPVNFILIAVIMNIILNPILIIGFNLGVAGSAYATIGSQAIAFFSALFYCIKKTDIPFTYPHKPKMKYMKALLKLGFFSGLQAVVISSGLTATVSLVATCGTKVFIGFITALKFDGLIMIPILTFSSVAKIMAGQNIGIQDWNRVNKITKIALIYVSALTLLVGIIVYLSAESIMRMFISDTESIQYGSRYLKTISFFYPFLGINFVLSGIISASGAVVASLVLSLIYLWAIRIPVLWFMLNWLGSHGVTLGLGISFMLSSIVALGYFILGRWRMNKILK